MFRKLSLFILALALLLLTGCSSAAASDATISPDQARTSVAQTVTAAVSLTMAVSPTGTSTPMPSLTPTATENPTATPEPTQPSQHGPQDNAPQPVQPAAPSLVMIPIILITSRADERDKIFGLEIGVDDFLTRPISSRVVIARVKALLRRCNNRQTTVSRVLQSGNLVLDPGRRELQVAGQPVDLTQVEFGLICTLMGKPGFVFTRDELVENALGRTKEGEGRTLDTHIKNLRRKIEADPHKPAHIHTVYGVGYKLMAG